MLRNQLEDLREVRSHAKGVISEGHWNPDLFESE